MTYMGGKNFDIAHSLPKQVDQHEEKKTNILILTPNLGVSSCNLTRHVPTSHVLLGINSRWFSLLLTVGVWGGHWLQ